MYACLQMGINEYGFSYAGMTVSCGYDFCWIDMCIGLRDLWIVRSIRFVYWVLIH